MVDFNRYVDGFDELSKPQKLVVEAYVIWSGQRITNHITKKGDDIIQKKLDEFC